MAPESGRAGTGLTARLLKEPYRFDFAQAVRLLERLLHQKEGTLEGRPKLPIGRDHLPEREMVRFRTQPGLTFPTSPVAKVTVPTRTAGEHLPPVEMAVTFLGLIGSMGVLPHHYTTLLLRRVREKDTSLRDLLDLFQHRLVSLFFRAWSKYRLPFGYERHRLRYDEEDEDLPTEALYCLVGMGTDGLRGRLEFSDETFLYYAGHFARRTRPAIALEAMLCDYFRIPVKVRQFHGRWLVLEPPDRSRLPSSAMPDGNNSRLGLDLIAGERIWDVQSMIRLRLGPLTGEQFRGLLPGTRGLKTFCQLVRSYVGPELEFDVQLVLKRTDVPSCCLGDESDPAWLGWNTWINSAECSVRDVDDPVFFVEEI